MTHTRRSWLRRSLAAIGTTGVVVAITLAGAGPANAALTNFGGSWTTEWGQLVMCKTLEYGGYGPVYKIMVVAASNPGKVVGGKVRVTRGSSTVGEVVVNARDGSWDVKYIYASAILGDTYATAAGVGELDGRGMGSGYGGRTPASWIATC